MELLSVYDNHNYGKHCLVNECLRKRHARGFCKLHYRRIRNTGSPDGLLVRPRGSGTFHRGYKIIQKNGKRGGEHKFVMEEVLGRELLPHESVHHKNGNRNDNRPENLELWVKSQPYGQRAEDLLAWAKEIIKIYGK